MYKFLRVIARHYLSWLTIQTLRKHQPFLVAVTGSGPTSLVREMAFSLVKEKYSTRKNDEVPEAEFNIPLTILGHNVYPESRLEWIVILLRYTFQVLWIKPISHALVIEVPWVTAEIQNFWLQILNPEITLQTGDDNQVSTIPGLVQLHSERELELWNELVEIFAPKLNLGAEDMEVAKLTLELPETNIRAYKLKTGLFIIDATHQYYAPRDSEIEELVNQFAGSPVKVLKGQKVKVLPEWRDQLKAAVQII